MRHSGARSDWATARFALLCAVAFLVGLTLPDADFVLGVGHRSAVTHSILPTLLLLADRRWYPVACGTAGGCGLHLAADSFPKAMIGYATIKLPFAGSIGASASYAWLAINAVAAVAIAAWLCARLFPPPVARILTGCAVIAGAWYLAGAGGGWFVLTIMGAAAAGSWYFRRRR